jgi:hypothetical protein
MIKAVKTVGTFAKREIQSALNDHKLKALINKTESPKIAEKILAKAKLKKDYPEIYSMLNAK